MKITNTPSVSLTNGFESQKPAPKNDASSQSRSISDDVVIKKDVLVDKINIIQKSNLQSQQMFGALTQLAEALELLRRQPNVYEQNIKEILAEAQKNSPHLSQYTQNSFQNLDQAILGINDARQQLSQKIASDKRELALYLVTEQNRDAIQNKSINLQDMDKIAQKMNQTTANKLYTTHVEQITKLLS
ncbi:MAG: hypothetical protein ACRCWI_02065 [Brevinema sp.]